MAAAKGQTQYILFNEDTDTHETFESDEELKEFLEDEDFSRSELKNLRVFEVTAEYEVTPSYELEEI